MSVDGHDLRRESAVTLSFSLVDGSQKMSKILPFRSFKGKESQENYAAEKVWEEVHMVMKDERLSHVKFFLCADMKSLLMCLGYKAANAKDGCLFCVCTKERWHLCCADNKCVLRGHRDESRWYLPPLKPSDPGFKTNPLVDSSQFWGVVIDILHMFFRVTDAIFGRVIGFMSVGGKDVFLGLCDDAGVKRFHVVDKSETAVIKFANLTRQKRQLLMEKVFLKTELVKCGITAQKACDAEEVCTRFATCIELMSVGGEDLTKAIRRFTALFCKLFQLSSVPYYVHILAHTPLLISLYGDLSVFQQQSVENLNCQLGRRYFAQTSCSTTKAVIACNRSLF